MTYTSYYCILFFLAFITPLLKAQSKTPGAPPYKVALFIPFQLDSLYHKHADNYQLTDSTHAEYSEDAWSFYLGTKMAIDSLNLLPGFAEKIQYAYYDTDQYLKDTLLSETYFQQPEHTPRLIIGYVVGAQASLLARYARKKNIPFISALYPHTLNEENSPSLIVLNPLLETHLKKTLYYLKKNPVKIILKKAEYPEIIQPLIEKITQDTLLKSCVSFLTLPDAETTYSLQQILMNYSAKNQTFFLLTFDMALIQKCISLIQNAASNEKIYTVGGLPLWEDSDYITSFASKSVKLCYSRSFYYNPKNPVIQQLIERYNYFYYRPFNKMIGLGFECVLHAIPLLARFPNLTAFTANINESSYKVFRNFNFYYNQTLISAATLSVPISACLVNHKVYMVVLFNRKTVYLD